MAVVRRISLFAAVAVVTALSTSSLEPGSGDGAYVAMTLEEKQVADAMSDAADSRVAHLEKARDEAWHNSRGSLAVASNPPIRSSAMFAMLSAETDKFAQLEVCHAAIKKGSPLLHCLQP